MDAPIGKRVQQLTVLPTKPLEIGSEPPLHEGSARSPDGMQAIQEIINSVRRYKRFVLRMALLGAVLAGLAGLLLQPSYMALAQFLVDSRQSSGGDGSGASAGSAGASFAADEAAIDTHVTVLLSDAYLRRLLPGLHALDAAASQSESQTLSQQIRGAISGMWGLIKTVTFIGDREPTEGAEVAALRRGLRVGQERRSRIISVAYVASDPQRAAAIANLIVQSYINDLVAQRRSEAERSLAAIASQSADIQNDLAKAERELNNYRTANPSQPANAALEWRVTMLAQQYEALLRRTQDITQKAMTAQPDIGVLALASPPERPASLHPLFLIPPAVIVFALLGSVIAVCLRRLDRTLHTEAEAAEALRIPCVGTIPSIVTERTRQLQYLLQLPESSYSKAIRSVLASTLASGSPENQQRTVLVASSLPGEGKSTLAWSLAVCAAHIGWRTLLINLNRAGRLANESVDLLDALTSGRPFTDAIQHIAAVNIDYLSAPTSNDGLLRVLANPEIRPALQQSSQDYDFVIIDGPSLAEEPEARLLANWADHILLVVRSASTSRDAADATLRQLVRTQGLALTQRAQIASVLTRASPQNGLFGSNTGAPRAWSFASFRRRTSRRLRAAADETRAAFMNATIRKWFASD